MKKITFMLLAFFAAVTANAQTGPMKASKLGESTTIDDLVGWTYWYHRTTSHEPVSDNNARNEIAMDVYNAETNPTGTTRTGGRYVVFTKVDESNIKIYGMFEMPVEASVTFRDGKIYNIIIPCDQVVAYDNEVGNIYLTQTTWVQSHNDGAGGWHTYEDVRMYFGFNSRNNEYYWYVSNNWIQLYSLDGEEKVPYGGNYIPSATYCYGYVAKNLSVVQYSDWNALMYVTFDRGIQDYPNTTYCVNVTQEGDVVKVENFNGGGTTVIIDLKDGNKLSIEPQTGIFGTDKVEYTYYPAVGGGIVGPDLEGKIEGTGTEDRLSWGDYCRVSEAYTYQYETGEIIFLNKDLNKFTFPEEDPMSINDIETENEVSGATYNVAGQKVDGNYRGIVIQNGKKLIRK